MVQAEPESWESNSLLRRKEEFKDEIIIHFLFTRAKAFKFKSLPEDEAK